MHHRGRRLHFYAGRDAARLLDFTLFIGIGPIATKARHGQYQHRWSLDIAWNWRPALYRVAQGPRHGAYPSQLWTGRRWDIVGWEWPFFFRCGFR